MIVVFCLNWRLVKSIPHSCMSAEWFSHLTKKNTLVYNTKLFFLIFKSRSSLRCFSSSTLVLFLSSFVVHFLLYISCLLLPILYLDWRSFRHYADSERKPEPPQTIRCMHFFPVKQQRSAVRGSSIVEVLDYTQVDKQTIRYTHTQPHETGGLLWTSDQLIV